MCFCWTCSLLNQFWNTCTHMHVCVFLRLFQIVFSNTMDLDGSWGQGSSRRDFHFVTFVTFRSPLAIQDELLSKGARSTTCGLRRYNFSIYQGSKRCACNDRFYIARSLIVLDTFGTFAQGCGFPWISHSCKLLFISMSNLGDTSSRTTRLHMTSPFSPDHLCPTQSVSRLGIVLSVNLSQLRRSELRVGGADAMRN